jgi:rhamnose utilization protein RhaD (predicted bifunctional aldolase and dehydrogenase)
VGYHFADAPALAPHAVRFAAAGAYYPDHLVFLGSGAATIDSVVGSPPVILAPGFPPLVRDDPAPAQLAMAGCLADVAARLAPDDRPRCFTPQEEYELRHWDAEVRRQSLPGAEGFPRSRSTSARRTRGRRWSTPRKPSASPAIS